MRRPCFAPPLYRCHALVTGVLALVCGACSGGGKAADASARAEDGSPGTGFVPQVGGAQDAALPGPHDPVRCGEWGQAYASAVAVSPDGTLLAVAGSRRRLLSTSDWHQVRPLEEALFRTESVQKLAFVANGSLLVEMTATEPLGFWRVEDGAFMYSLDFALPARRPRWQQIAVSDTSLLALSDGRSVVLWDAQNRTVALSIAPTQGQVGPLALSHKADVLALVEGERQDSDASVGFASARVSLWDPTRGRHLRTITLDHPWVTALALSPDAGTLAAVAQSADCPTTCESTIDFYRTSDGQSLGHTVPWTTAQESWPATRLAYLPQGGSIAAVYPSPNGPTDLVIFRVSDGALLNLMPFSGDPVFTPAGNLVRPGPSIEIRSVSDGTILDLVAASTDNQAPTFSPDGQVLASVDGNDVVLWRVAEGVVSTRFSGLGKNVQALAFSPHGRILASGGKDGVVRIWNIDQTSEPVVQKQGQPITAVVFTPDGERLLTGDSNGRINVRATNTGVSADIWYGQSSIAALALSPDGTWLVSGGKGPPLRLWDVRTGQAIASAAHGAGVVALAFSPDGSRLVSAAARANCASPCPLDEGDPELKVWRVLDASLSLESNIPTVPTDFPQKDDPRVNTHAAVWALAFAPDGRSLLTAGPQNAGHLYRVPEGTALGSFGSLSAGTPFAVSPDARHIVTGASPLALWCSAPSGP